jgi:Domain of unknown function (DUF4175)
MGELRENQQALRDQLKKLMEELRKKGFGQGQQGQGEMDQLGRAGEAMGDAEGQLGKATRTARSIPKAVRSKLCAGARRTSPSRCNSRACKPRIYMKCCVFNTVQLASHHGVKINEQTG